MLHGRKYASKIDIKLGTSTCSMSILDDPAKLKRRLKVDRETTSHSLGFNIGGISLKDSKTGKFRDLGKIAFNDEGCKTRDEAKERLTSFFMNKDGYDMNLIDYVTEEL